MIKLGRRNACKNVKECNLVECTDRTVYYISDTRSFATFWYLGYTSCTVPLCSYTILRGALGDYPSSILGGKYPIIGIRDLTTGYDNTKPGNKAILPVSKSGQMITFTFKNGLVTTLRTSGTEPKIKYYSELCASPEQQDFNELKSILNEMVSAIIAEFLQPEVNALIARSP